MIKICENVKKSSELALATKQVKDVRHLVSKEIVSVEKTVEKFSKYGSDDEMVRQKLLEHFSLRLDQLHHLFPSPFFVRCDVQHQTDHSKKIFYFGKFSFTDSSIFSWMVPAARLRFLDIGPAEYVLPDGSHWSGKLIRKDQFMIVDGRIVFMVNEAADSGRTLIHQEALSRLKPGFMLPEIVAKMERAQDDVIRASSTGSFLIAGPAGSGKTTLAFHRIAYLLQSPDTSERFSSRSTIVFVQDEGSRAYFSRLLPDLGIHDVTVTTFGEWALERLGISEGQVVRRPNGVDDEIDAYESKKQNAMRFANDPLSKDADPFRYLRRRYLPFFTKNDLERFEEQKAVHAFDRFDLTLLLQQSRKNDGAFKKEVEYFEQKKNFEVIRRKKMVPLSYSLIVIDETQNYLPEQIQLLRTSISKDTNATLYVGDLGQQVLLGTVRDWSEAGEDFSHERKVVLEKVYRNTRAILTYLSNLGFDVTIPEGIREGKEVLEEVFLDKIEERDRIQKIIAKKEQGTHVGILCPSSEYLETYRSIFNGHSDIHVLTIHEAQGVEFDMVFLVGVPHDFFHAEGERLKIKRDLIYVAMTRAMEELYVFSRTRLSDLL